MSYLYHYSVRFECRPIGSIGAFEAKVFDTMAPDAAGAVDLVRADIADTYETRFGGDVRGDGDHCWKSLDGQEQPLELPCQVERLTRGN